MGALFLSHLLVLSCYMALASGRVVERSPQSDQDSDFLHHYSDLLLDVRDEFSQHMLKLYEQYNRQHRFKEGNTVRGVNSIQGSGDQRMLFHLNLTSLQDSEVILSATFHFLFDHQPRHKPWHCKRPRRPSCRTLPVHPVPSITLLFHSVSSGSPGSLLGNMTLHPHRRGLWQMKDVTQVIKEALHKGHQFLCVELDLGQQYQRQPAEVLAIGSLPYVLLYADDQVLAEPNSVVASLQRYDPLTEDGHSSRSTLPYTANDSPETKGRVTREAPLPFDPIQNNELPEVDDGPARYTKDSLWESTWHLALKPKSTILNKGSKKTHEGVSEVKGNGVHSKEEPQVLREEKTNRQTLHSDGTTVMELSDKDFKSPVGPSAERRHQGRDGRKHKARAGGGIPESPVLSFDERTLRKVRRRQWGDSQHGGCSRRNLRVDFADIGWSEWVIAPKAFDAFYCAGTCGFPIPKVARPTNHATIQSIVRAVGIIPGVPEPCCVPEKMSPLAVLYHEQARNMVLKVYPNMSVQSCSCR